MATQTQTHTRPGLVAENLKLMRDGDGAFNRRDNAYFEAAHHRDMVAHVMGDPAPLRGRDALGRALEGMRRAFPDMKVDNNYPIQFGAADWTTVAGKVRGTFTGELVLPDGKVIPGTGKAFDLVMTTIARWQDGMMMEEWVFWDSALMNQQIGLA
jgi:predicted ester cyclase